MKVIQSQYATSGRSQEEEQLKQEPKHNSKQSM
jgi:hypothetical protein